MSTTLATTTATASATTTSALCNPTATPSVPLATLQAILPNINSKSNYCQFSWPEAAPDLKTCCVTGQNALNVQGCTQACQSNRDVNSFKQCVVGLAPAIKDAVFVCVAADGTTAKPSSSGAAATSGTASGSAASAKPTGNSAARVGGIKGLMVVSVALLAVFGTAL